MKLHNNRVRVLAFVLTLVLMIGAVPAEAHSAVAKKKKAKATCTLTLNNLSTDTVLKKGKSFKVQYAVKTSNNKKATVWFRSSNKRVATVSRKGVIKAKKKGTVKITAYARAKGGKTTRKTVKIRVGTPASGVSIKGSQYLRAGRSSTLKASVAPKNATNKKVVWSSSNPAVATVDQSGKVTAKGNGKVTITATAADSSGAHAAVTVYSHRYTKNDANWIAHRGLHEKATENTAEAFRLAGKAGFWGCECDIWETKHTGSGEDEAFDIVINHDNNFKRLFGVSTAVKDLTAEAIRSDSRLNKVCFFDEYLKICAQYNMIPVIEIKDYAMTDAGIAKFVDMVNEYGLLERAQFISFGGEVLARTQQYILDAYGVRPYTGYLIFKDDILENVNYAKNQGFSGINIAHFSLTPELNNKCKRMGLKIGTWTYENTAERENMLGMHLLSGVYSIDTITVDYKVY